MRQVTRLALGALVLVLAGSAQAQDKNVTFQVNMSPYITSCQFDDATADVVVRGSFNDWAGDATKLADADGDGTFTGTFAFAEGTALAYKFVSTGDLAFEDGTGNREYTVTADADQTIGVVTFADGDPVDECTTETVVKKDAEVFFQVDMNVAIARGVFDKTTDKLYVAGGLTGWGDAAGKAEFELAESTTTDGVYTALIPFDTVAVGTAQEYKYIIQDPADTATIGWEAGDNASFMVTEDATDADSNGFVEVNAGSRFYSRVSFDQVLEAPATVTFRVDLSPAVYFLADSTGGLPFSAGSAVTGITGLSINGPALWESTGQGGPSGGLTDWASWGADGLGSIADASFTKEVDTDFWTLTVEYPVGALRTLVGKLGVNGSDNEAANGNDAFFPIVDGTTINLVFGAVLKADGTYEDADGPNGNPAYDPYILVDNAATPPTARSVRNGGENDIQVAIEDGPGIAGLEIGSAYPNPTRGLARLDLTLDRALDLRVAVYDVVGRKVATLADGLVAAGATTVGMDVAGFAPGVYLLRIEADGRAVTRRMTVLR